MKNFIIYSIVIILMNTSGAYFHERDMLKNLDKGYIYTWTKGNIEIKKDEK